MRKPVLKSTVANFSIVSQRFFDHADIRDSNECWNWMGACDSKEKYGKLTGFLNDGRKCRWLWAHRVSWWIYRGEIPDNLHIDHLCRNRRCVNPDHLEPVTTVENTRRGHSHVPPGARYAARKYCKHGHKFTPSNTRIKLTKYGQIRGCRKCADIYQMDLRKKRLANGWSAAGGPRYYRNGSVPKTCIRGHRLSSTNIKKSLTRVTCKICVKEWMEL